MEAISRASASEPDCARYQIFGTLPSDAVARSSRESAADPDDAASIAEALEATRAACMSHLEPHVEGYIWQKDPFQLEVVAATPPGTSRSGTPAHLAGVTRFGDNVEDEWFIVWMLRELTRAFPALVARVWDDDGEFLLIETAFHLPRWLKPETAANRVWLCGGEMRVVPPEADARLGAWARRGPAAPGAFAVPSVEAALWLARGGDGEDLAACAEGEEGEEEEAKAKAKREAHETKMRAANAALSSRLAPFPESARASTHRCVAVLPARLAALLAREPQLIAPATQAFYLRDPAGLNAAARAAFFPLRDATQTLVTTTRCLYAQLDRQRFEPSRAWRAAVEVSGACARRRDAETLGAKIAAGFEILAEAWNRDGLCDLREPAKATAGDEGAAAAARRDAGGAGGGSDPTRAAFFASLERNGYFRGEMRGSAAHRRLHAAAAAQYEKSAWSERARAASAAPATRAAAALAAADAEGVADASRRLCARLEDGDSDAWMRAYAGESDDPLEVELAKREAERRERRESTGGGFGGEDDFSGAKKNGDADGAGASADPLAAMAERLRAFMGERSGHEGVEDALAKNANTISGNENENHRTGLEESADDDESLLDARAFMAELGAALGVGGGGGGLMGGTVTDSDDDFSSDDDLSSASGSSSDGGDEEDDKIDRRGRYVYDNDEGGEWGGAAFSEEYERAMRRQLEGTAAAAPFAPTRASPEKPNAGSSRGVLPRGFEGSRGGENTRHTRLQQGSSSSSESDESDGEADGEPLNVDLNLVSNVLASYREQAGAAGPASQLLASLGVDGVGFGNLHSDDDEEGAEEEGAEQTRC
jgi:hypothetical protein